MVYIASDLNKKHGAENDLFFYIHMLHTCAPTG